MKARCYPNFIQKRQGNKIHFLTEVIGGRIIRRTFDLNSSDIITLEIDEFLSDVSKEVRGVIMKQRLLNDAKYDGQPYTITDLPEGIGILDVMTEIKRDNYISPSGSDTVTEEEAEQAINKAVERKRATQSEEK